MKKKILSSMTAKRNWQKMARGKFVETLEIK
jgi:hypothetical protein